MAEIFKGGYRLTQGFGKEATDSRLLFFYNSLGLAGHNGLDLCPKEWRDYKSEMLSGSPRPDLTVYAPFDIHIIHCENSYKNTAGAYVKGSFVVDGKSYIIWFFHLDSWFDSITHLNAWYLPAGSPIGIMGGSGNGKRFYFAPHLHLQVRPFGVHNTQNGYKGCIDPTPFLGR